MRPGNRTEKSRGEMKRSNCRCGHCPICVENARWERIFNEKFADPQYYSRQPNRNSPLSDL